MLDYRKKIITWVRVDTLNNTFQREQKWWLGVKVGNAHR